MCLCLVARTEPGKFDLVYQNPDGTERVEYAVTLGSQVTYAYTHVHVFTKPQVKFSQRVLQASSISLSTDQFLYWLLFFLKKNTVGFYGAFFFFFF